MGGHRARVTGLTSGGRVWPLIVRRARADDREAVLGFASDTWDGWDYVPHAWPVWLTADDGVLLVACAGAPADGSDPLDRDGQPLQVGRPLGIARVALVSATEIWLEGIRVDPRVRGMDVATDLQAAELQWAAAQAASVVRYATGEGNEGSHRLGARHGFSLLAMFRSYWWSESDADDEDEDDSGFGEEARAEASALRATTLDRLRQAGLLAGAADAGRWWARLSNDPNFIAGARLYEHRAWALQALTPDAFGQHVQRGEVLAIPAQSADELTREQWALAILEREALPSEDISLHLGLLAGDGRGALELVDAIRQAADRSLRFRLPADDAPLLRGQEGALAAAGFRAREWRLDILARPLDAAHPPPEPTDPAMLVLEDRPAAGLRPPA